MDPTTHYVAVPGCLATNLGDEVIVLNLESGVYYGLNPVAACVWNRISTSCSLADLAAAVEDEFDTEGQDVEGDVRRLLDTLCGHGVVTEVGVAAAVA
ncbi:MAG: PqqD family protein [Longimicrobiaceae bacterium]